jgi:hypothetical protein
MDLQCHSIDMDLLCFIKKLQIEICCVTSSKYSIESSTILKLNTKVKKVLMAIHKQCKIFLHRHVMGVYHIVTSLILDNEG